MNVYEYMNIEDLYSDITEKFETNMTFEEFAELLKGLPERPSPKLVAMDGTILSWCENEKTTF
jgi:hypothetical protein